MAGHFEDPLTKKQAYHETWNESTGGRCRTFFALFFAQESALTVNWFDVARVIIGKLPGDVLLEIFDFYLDKAPIEAWHTLVHVCQKWRNVVFGSPQRLELRLHCTESTPVRRTLDAWPLLPIVVLGYGYEEWGADNIVAALEHNDRIPQMELFDFPSSQMEKVLAEMRRPFPALKYLHLQSIGGTVPAVPDSFLGGSAPRLQELSLEGIPLPRLPKLLVSAPHLVELRLRKIPHSGYFSPEAMATCFSTLSRLEKLVISFESSRCRPEQKSRHLPPQTRALLPVLTNLCFVGVSEYLDDLVARIDAPLLDNLEITFFYQLIFDTPRLTQFISRTPKLKLKAHDEAHVKFSDWAVWVNTFDRGHRAFTLAISCRQSDWQLSSLAQVCSSSLHEVFIPAVERLYILEEKHFQVPPSWPDDIETSQWLELLHPFTALKDLYISREFTPRISPTLQELVEGGVTEVLPALQTLFLEEAPPSGPVQETIGKFVVARQLAGHPIAISL